MVFPDLGTEVDTVGLGVISLSKSSLFGLIPLIKSFISSLDHYDLRIIIIVWSHSLES